MSGANDLYPISIAEMRQRYLKLYSGAVNDVMRFDYKVNAALPSSYLPLRENMKLCGQAFTVKGAPDITTDGEFEMRAQMLESLPADSIVVYDCTGDTVTAQWGEVMTMAAKRAGCRGAFINGIRDTEAILQQDFPVFHQYRTNVGMLGRFRMFHYQKPIRIGEIVINPGDWIFGDIDGAIRIPKADAYTVLLRAEEILKKEVGIRDMVNSGMKPTKVVEKGGYF
ncbi:MAG: RraA family protein [Lentisphaerae bacterium]|nr:RraA family protein [Lentisphaerota bacterium]